MSFNMINNPNPFVACSLQWLDFCKQATEQSRRNMDEARRLNARMLQDFSFWMESYMRSPLFLELMRCNVAMAAQWANRPGASAGEPFSPVNPFSPFSPFTPFNPIAQKERQS